MPRFRCRGIGSDGDANSNSSNAREFATGCRQLFENLGGRIARTGSPGWGICLDDENFVSERCNLDVLSQRLLKKFVDPFIERSEKSGMFGKLRQREIVGKNCGTAIWRFQLGMPAGFANSECG